MKSVKRRYLRYFLCLMMMVSVMGSVAQDTPRRENEMPNDRREEEIVKMPPRAYRVERAPPTFRLADPSPEGPGTGGGGGGTSAGGGASPVAASTDPSIGAATAEGSVVEAGDSPDVVRQLGQSPAAAASANQGNKGFSSQTTEKFRSLSSLEFGLSLIVLLFGMGVILLEIYLVTKQHISATETVKFIIITLIIISTLFLITAGYDNDQIAPAIGLLGTIAGYLLGRITNEDKPKGGDGSVPPTPPSV